MYYSLLFLLLLIVCGGGENATEPHVTAPVEFPKNTSDYNVIQNNTILDDLNNHEMIDTEVDDLANGGTLNNTPPQSDETLAGNVFTKENFKKMMPEEETELIQTGNNEDNLREERQSAGNAQGQGVPVVQGQVAAILAGVFVLIAAIGYAGLLTWRRYLENRYGSRDLLVNEDVGPFSL